MPPQVNWAKKSAIVRSGESLLRSACALDRNPSPMGEGARGRRSQACGGRNGDALLVAFLGGLLGAWRDDAGLAMPSAGHGNTEDIEAVTHTSNAARGLLEGFHALRDLLIGSLHGHTDLEPCDLRTVFAEEGDL